MPTLAGAWRKWLVFILDLGKSTQSSWSISTSTAGAYARNNKIIRNRGSHMWFLIQWLELSAAVPCHQESTMHTCIGGTIIVEALRATHGQVIVLARCFQTCNLIHQPINFPLPPSFTSRTSGDAQVSGRSRDRVGLAKGAYGSCHNPLVSQHRRESSQFVSWLGHSNSKHTNCQNWWHCSWRYLEKACTFPEDNNLGILASTIQTVTHQDWHSKYRLLTYHIFGKFRLFSDCE